MRLTSTENRMLHGDYGSACQLAMKILNDLGNLYAAERMIQVSQAHLDMTLYMVDAGVEFAEHMAVQGGKFSVPTQLNPASIDLTRYRSVTVTPSARGKFFTAWLLGTVAALLAGACVAPVVIAVIVYAGTLYSEGYSTALLLPFLLGFGMALPWPFAGAGLTLLPDFTLFTFVHFYFL